MVMLETCNESCNTIDDLNGRICVLNKTKTGSINLSNMAISINAAKALTKHISCDCKCKFDGKVVYKIIAISAVESAIRYCLCKKDYIWYPSICDCKIAEYFKNYSYKCLINNSVITYDEILDKP